MAIALNYKVPAGTSSCMPFHTGSQLPKQGMQPVEKGKDYPAGTQPADIKQKDYIHFNKLIFSSLLKNHRQKSIHSSTRNNFVKVKFMHNFTTIASFMKVA